ncbi:MAG: hypothetical protein JXR94_03000, partial [Candidatus Hydrogenedentes bacterium]|nr:hypothetical protein [Candidatus Hydrogenedentota bacterium]
TLAVSGLMMIIGGQSESSARFLSGMDIGLFVGVMIGSIWGVVRVFEPSVYIAPVFGGALGFVFTVIYHVLEEKFVAPSDHSLMVIATIGTCGGAFFGFFSDRFREYLEER